MWTKEMKTLRKVWSETKRSDTKQQQKQATDVECDVFCTDTMENWDEKKLEEVVNKKHGEAEKKKAKTQIVCVTW